MALCVMKSTTTTEIPSSGRIHRRAVKFGKPENVVKREINHLNHQKRSELFPPSSFRHKRGKGGDQPQANNLASMQEFVTELMQMNKDWQKQSMESPEEGKKPKEFSWDEFEKHRQDPSDYGKDDYSDTSNGNQPQPSTKKTSDTSSHPKKPSSKPPQSSTEKDDKPKQTPKPPPQPKPEPKPEPEPKEQPKPQPKPEPKQQSKPQPKPEPKHQPKPEPKPQPKPEPKPQPKPKPQQNNDDDNGGNQDSHGKSGIGGVVAQHGFAGKLMKGDMTYFTPDVGACGWPNNESDFIVAVSAELFQIFGGGISNGNPVCGHRIRIHKNGKTAIAVISDECPPCKPGSLDMTPALFNFFENPDVGRTSVEWEFI